MFKESINFIGLVSNSFLDKDFDVRGRPVYLKIIKRQPQKKKKKKKNLGRRLSYDNGILKNSFSF